MNWGKSIVLAFVLFAAFIATLVIICARESVDLVTKDYYHQELQYQKQIDRIDQTATLASKPFIGIEHGMVKVEYADFQKVEDGVLELFRPSDPLLDKTFALNSSDNSVQFFSTEGMQKGMYRARMKWTMKGEEFFIEQLITL